MNGGMMHDGTDGALLGEAELAEIRGWVEKRERLFYESLGMDPIRVGNELAYLSQRISASTPRLLAHIDALTGRLAAAERVIELGRAYQLHTARRARQREWWDRERELKRAFDDALAAYDAATPRQPGDAGEGES